MFLALKGNNKNKLLTEKEKLLNPLKAELNPICHLLALLRAQPILHVSRISVKQFFTG